MSQWNDKYTREEFERAKKLGETCLSNIEDLNEESYIKVKQILPLIEWIQNILNIIEDVNSKCDDLDYNVHGPDDSGSWY